MKKRLFSVALVVAAATAVAATGAMTWNFDKDRDGMMPAGFYRAAGQWKVKADATAPSKPNVLAQMARSSADTFNLALVAGTSFRDLDLAAKVRAVGGKTDQGGGLVWRAQDARNYYVARYNPLKNNYVLYKVHNYGRVELAHAGIERTPGWHTLRVVMRDDHIECYFDGKKYLDVRDATFREKGQIGLWTKADAVTYFDDLTVAAK
jgi:hypothetical protein